MRFRSAWHQQAPESVAEASDHDMLARPEALAGISGSIPENTALHRMGRTISCRELDSLVKKLSSYAAFRIGAMRALNNPLLSVRELTRQLNTSGAEILIIPAPLRLMSRENAQDQKCGPWQEDCLCTNTA